MVSKGINADKLAKWMVRAIPHKFDWETKKFGKKYTSTQRHRAAEDFVAKNPDFYKWVPPQKNGSIKEIKEDELSKHVKAIRSSTTEILKGDHKSLTSTEIRTIEKAISDLQSMLYGIRLVSGSTSKSDTKVQFVSGGLPSLGKKRR